MPFLWKHSGLCVNIVKDFLCGPNEWGWMSVQDEVFIVRS